jgi:hypothetical protein
MRKAIFPWLIAASRVDEEVGSTVQGDAPTLFFKKL